MSATETRLPEVMPMHLFALKPYPGRYGTPDRESAGSVTAQSGARAMRMPYRSRLGPAPPRRQEPRPVEGDDEKGQGSAQYEPGRRERENKRYGPTRIVQVRGENIGHHDRYESAADADKQRATVIAGGDPLIYQQAEPSGRRLITVIISPLPEPGPDEQYRGGRDHDDCDPVENSHCALLVPCMMAGRLE
jgi:hypothetical protein